MDIKLIPAQTSVLIDSNILIYHLGGLSTDCKGVLSRIQNGEIKAYVTTIIIAETLHKRMIAEAIAKGLISSGQPLKKLKANPTVISSLADYITDIENLLKLPLNVIEVTLADVTAGHALRQSYGLFVNDSINLACAQRLGIANIVTHDTDFTSVQGITVWHPTDI